jgi:hypothetical protein
MQERGGHTERATWKQDCSAEHVVWLGEPPLNAHHVTKAQLTSNATTS